MSDEAAVEACFAETLERFGRVDGCFANAGVSGRAGVSTGRAPAFHEMPTDDWRRVMGVNLDGTFFTFRAAAKHSPELEAAEQKKRKLAYEATIPGKAMKRLNTLVKARLGLRDDLVRLWVRAIGQVNVCLVQQCGRIRAGLLSECQ